MHTCIHNCKPAHTITYEGTHKHMHKHKPCAKYCNLYYLFLYFGSFKTKPFSVAQVGLGIDMYFRLALNSD